ncbi:MAG: choice-of-anchor D domain-containing protein [Candidatus Kapabacteria bacterium]|nr:choice-of-anchor D domain-containing protein [Candidatus Kapabacteria bacterium]
MRMKIISTIIILFIAVSNLWSSLYITERDFSNYPNVSIKLFPFNAQDLLINNLTKADFKILSNNKEQTPLDYSCPNQNPIDNISLVLMMDLSISSYDSLKKNFLTSKKIANQIIERIKTTSEIAISSFNAVSYLNREFTNNKTILTNTINSLNNTSGAIYDAGFLSEPTGSISIAKTGKNKKIILLITDGAGSASVSQIVNAANVSDISIYSICIGGHLSNDIKAITKQTGGYWFEGVSDSISIKNVINTFIYLSYNFKPCTLSWINELNCDDINNVEIINKRDSSNVKFSEKIKDQFKITLEITPPFLRFGAVPPGLSKSINVSFTARNGDINISSLNINNPRFVIDSGNITSPELLRNGTSHTIRIKFTPTDSAIVFDSLRINSDACKGKILYMTGGYPNTPPKERTLTLLAPNCGEKLLVGDTFTVKWTGLLPADVIQLEYSTDNGRTWDTLAKDMVGLEYRWIVPDKPSDSCLVRVVQLWPNNIGQTIDLHHYSSVNSANFNKEGDLIITASKDSLARIWNSNNGVEIFKLRGHTGFVNSAVIDQFDVFAVTASDDSTAIIWNVRTGDSLRTLRGHKHTVRSANFSPDGSKIITASSDRSFIIWDSNTGSPLDTVCCNDAELWFANYSPDGSVIFTTNNTGLVNFYDSNTLELIKTFNTRNGVIPYASFSADMKLFVTASWFGKALIWDYEKGDTLYSIAHDTSIVPLNSANFDYSGEYLLTAGNDFVANMWNAKNGSFIAKLLEHTSAVQSATFNFDRSRVLTSSWDSTAKVWNLKKRDLQTDSSDCVFSIIRPDVEAKDIDFGPLAFGSVKDSLITTFIKNRLPIELEIKDIDISGTNDKDFTLLDGFAPLKLAPGDSHSIKLRFLPTDIGDRLANINISLPGRTITKILKGNSYDPGLYVVTPVIDFQKVELGDFKDTLITAVVKNRTPFDIQISKISKLGPDTNQFAIIEGNLPVVLKQNQEHKMKLRFSPIEIGRTMGSIEFEHNAKGSPSKILLFGEGVKPITDTVTIIIGDITGAPEQIIEIPVYLRNVTKTYNPSNISYYEFDLTFNSTLLEPLENTLSDNISTDQRTVRLRIPPVILSDSTLTKLKFKVGLGNDTLSILKPSNVSVVGKSKIVIYEKAGIFKLEGFCEEGGLRLFEPDSRLYLSQNKPNPFETQTEIFFEVFEKGFTQLTIYDIFGRNIKTVLEDYLEPGKYSVMVDSENMSSGIYLYVLSTPTQKLNKLMQVKK